MGYGQRVGGWGSASERDGLSRRRLFAVAASIPLLPLLAQRASAATALHIHPREDWAHGLAPRGPMSSERRGDVRFLLVHHTESANGYAQAEVPEQLRSFYGYHVGPKGWPDIAYNFLVDAYGGVWEGRAGSLHSPVKGDATGGSQGFSQLACFIGDHQTVPPTAAAQASMVQLLAHLAKTYGISTAPGATTTFVSRGSNRWPAGKTVIARTISGHREMSETACPGDAAFALIPSWRQRAHALVPVPKPAARVVVAGTSAALPSASVPPAATSAAAVTAVRSQPPVAAVAARTTHGTSEKLGVAVAGAAVAGIGAVAGLVVRARSRQH